MNFKYSRRLVCESHRCLILEPLNIEARYPSHKERLMKSLTKERCQSILENTKTLKTWITEKL
jgi:hypothetical protein